MQLAVSVGAVYANMGIEAVSAKHAASCGWHALSTLYEASAEEMVLGRADMQPAWKLLLFGNGSPTQHLALLSGSPTQVDVICMETSTVKADEDAKQPCVDALSNMQSPLCRRQVWLRNARGERLGYATTWLHEDDVSRMFPNAAIPIGTNIMHNKTELFREMKHVFLGHSEALTHEFGNPGPFWGRSYWFWLGGRPLAFIYEVFSPALEKYAGSVLAEKVSAVCDCETVEETADQDMSKRCNEVMHEMWNHGDP